MSAPELLQIFLMSERIRQLRMRAIIHQRISAAARQRAKRLTLIYLATVAREREAAASQGSQSLSSEINAFRGMEMPRLSEEEFLERFHISKGSFNFILDKLSFQLNRLKIIPVWKQVAVSLAVLASTESFKTIGEIFGIDRGTVSKVLLEFCYGVNLILQEEFMKFYPPTAETISKNREGFEALSGLPQAYGAVGLFRIIVKTIDKKMRSSMKILAAADHRNKFTYVEVGLSDERSDVFEKSLLKDYHKCNKLFYDMSRKLGEASVPIFLVGDSNFQLQPYLITPYHNTDLSPNEVYFNAVLRKSHKCVVDAFAQAKKRFPRLEKCKNVQADRVPLLMKTICILHNILIERNDLLNESPSDEESPRLAPIAIDEDGWG
uniref:Putative nuclease harbi1 n=1 Tax=Lutzomyia longipalpis TaxID=7200 RepID=A0A1B0CFI8_LUTLO